MEQGTITITKAAIHVKVNARTSVLAAANPIGGRYNDNATLHENIGLEYPLVSRFDLVFVMKDVPDRENDTSIAANVIRNHRYRNPQEIDGEVLDLGNNFTRMTTKNEIDENDPSNIIYEMYNPLLHGPQKVNILSSGFFKKYISTAKLIKPIMTDKACDDISEEYVKLRFNQCVETGAALSHPVTVRTLETLIRISQRMLKLGCLNT